MKTVNIYEAKTNLSKLLERVQNGEEIVIAKAGKPIASLNPYNEQTAPQLGIWQSNPEVMIPDDFDDMDPEIMSLFLDGQLFPDGKV
ncbi:MAG: type II toxin-antitoxin system Phd/YefM family antitoxin [Candidatus Saccharimonadales bacterium]